MRNLIAILIYGVLAMVTFRCEEPVDLGVVLPDNTLLVSSVLYPEDPAEVYVASVNGYITNSAASMNEATVEIFGNGNTPVARLDYVEGSYGLYRAAGFYPQHGRTYQVRVFADDYGWAFADSYVPFPTQITNLEINDLLIEAVNNEIVYDFNLKIEYEDPEEIINYYHLKLFQLRKQFIISESGDTIITGSTSTAFELPLPESNEYRLTGNNDGILFTDTPFDSTYSFALTSKINPETEMLGQIRTELRTVSREYYNHQVAIANGSVNYNGGLTQPGNGYGNVKNGTGTVSGYSGASDTIVVN